jgi:hypothetical protein
MIRLSTLFWLVLISATGFAMFAVKYEVQALADELAQTSRRAGDAEQEIRVLDAEWAYLNRPGALAQMNQRYLSLAPIATRQLRTGVTDIAMRPVPPPAPIEPAPIEPAPIENVAATGAAAAVAAASTPPGAPVAGQLPPPPSLQPAAPVVIAALETPAPAPEPARAAPVKTAAKPSPPRRAKSLDDLIAQISDSR